MLLQGSEGFGKFGEGRAIAKSAGLTLNDRQIVPPIVDRLSWAIMRAADDTMVFANNQAFRSHNNTIGIDSEADWTIGEGCRNAVSVPIEVHEAGRGHPLGMLDEAIEETRCRHECLCFLSPKVGDGAAHLSVSGLLP